MRKLLVLGSDYYTKDIVEEAKRRGIYVVVADYNKETPTKNIANERWLISTADTAQIIEKCKSEKIEAIITGASDFNTEQARTICKELGYPLYCESDLAWKASRNKALFKKVCEEEGVSVAKRFDISDELTDDEISTIKFPVVVKPVDKSANRGMSYCYNKEDLIAGYQYARSISDTNDIIVERMLSGTEHHVCYCAANGEIRLVSFAEAYHNEGERANIYSYENNTSMFLKQYIEETNEGVIRVFKKLGCTNGIVWVDTMRDSNDGKFYILEMGYRIAAALASSPLYEKVNGFNAIKWMVDCAMGDHHNLTNMPKPLTEPYKSIVAQAHMFVNKDATITQIDGIETVSKLDDVIIDIPKKIGDKINAFMSVALFTIYGVNCEDVIKKLKVINSKFKVYDEKSNNVVIYYDNYEKIRCDYEQGNSQFMKAIAKKLGEV